MKKLIKSAAGITNNDIIYVTMYLHPIIYETSGIFQNSQPVSATVNYDKYTKRYHTDINPSRIINGPLSDYGQELEPPIKNEWEGFIADCKWLVEELGFIKITSTQSIDSNKSEYILIFGIDGRECGTLIFDLRLSDHPLDAAFPDEYKDIALKYLTLHKILDGAATEAGIDFSVEQVIVGNVKNDTWDKALERLYLLLRKLKRKIGHRLNERGR